jgi:asparagine synthase (glutamine-hydrolysing)
MCGFSGFIEPPGRRSSDDMAAIAQQMAQTLVHRGPDDEGLWTDPGAGVALAFRRLAIMDLTAAGHQPMASASGRSVIVFNGEVYNAAELCADLEKTGLSFRGHSDTEVILEAIERWGVRKAVARFIGMFAIAFWNRDARRLTLVRDRLGIKPLYYGGFSGTFLFGSVSKSFRPHPDFTADIDRNALAAFMRFGYVPAPFSIFENVSALRPGELLEFEAGKIVARDYYWDARGIAARAARMPLSLSDGEAIEQFEALLSSAVSLRLLADVPIGAFLSGGIDSSTVVALMQTHATERVKTFSIGFDEPAYNEAPHALAIAQHLGTNHRELIVRPQDLLDTVPRIVDHFDEPFADGSQVPTYLLSVMTRQHVTVALSGDGGDELFAGYARYQIADKARGYLARVPHALRPWLTSALRRMPAGAWDRLAPLVPKRFGQSPLSQRVERLCGLMERGGEEAVFKDIVGQWPMPEEVVIGGTLPHNDLWSGSMRDAIRDFVPRMQFIDTLTYLPDDILVKVDRTSMAVGLEARVPIIDHRVVEFCWRLPYRFKVRDGETKWLLRRVLERHVPRSLFERPKMGFMFPIDEWLRGPLREWAEDLLEPEKMAAEGYFRPAPIQDMWRQHLSGQSSWHYRLWCVLMFQAWKRRWASS